MKFKKIFFLASISLSLILYSCKRDTHLYESKLNILTKQEVLYQIGRLQFIDKCSKCHNATRVLDNPLRDAIIYDKYEFSYLYKYLTSSDSLLKVNDSEIIALKEKYNSYGKNHKVILSKNELKAILYYVNKIPNIEN